MLGISLPSVLHNADHVSQIHTIISPPRRLVTTVHNIMFYLLTSGWTAIISAIGQSVRVVSRSSTTLFSECRYKQLENCCPVRHFEKTSLQYIGLRYLYICACSVTSGPTKHVVRLRSTSVTYLYSHVPRSDMSPYERQLFTILLIIVPPVIKSFFFFQFTVKNESSSHISTMGGGRWPLQT